MLKHRFGDEILIDCNFLINRVLCKLVQMTEVNRQPLSILFVLATTVDRMTLDRNDS